MHRQKSAIDPSASCHSGLTAASAVSPARSSSFDECGTQGDGGKGRHDTQAEERHSALCPLSQQLGSSVCSHLSQT